MPALVQHQFEKGFIIDEERIRKIADTLNKRLTSLEGSPKPTFKVFRADNFAYSTENVQDIINERNFELERIVLLIIAIDMHDKLNFAVRFSHDGCSLEISGEDRDFIYLLFSDLREYIKNEVCTKKDLEIDKFLRVFFPLGFLFMIAWLLHSMRLGEASQGTISAILANPDIAAKINYLVEQRSSVAEMDKPLGGLVIFGAILTMLTIAEKPIQKMFKLLFPANVFLFGKERGKYERMEQIRRNIFWGIIVALIVSVIGGLIVWQMAI